MPEKKKLPRSPWLSLSICIAAVIYFVSPVDIVPDIVFGFGQLDDLAIMILGVSEGVKAFRIFKARKAAKQSSEPPVIDVDGKEL